MIESLIRDGIDFLLHNPIGQLILITIEALALIGPLLIAVAYLTYAERKVLAAMQLRKGPNVVGPFGLFQPFADAIKKLKKGHMTDVPVQTQFGWHVIRVDDERAMKFPSFEEVKPQIVQNQQRQQLDKMIADLRAKAKVD